jgi:DNA-binding CsgD family transcriptional regulator
MSDRSSDDVIPSDLGCVFLLEGDTEVALLSFTPTRRARLTEAERDVVIHVMGGLSNAQIAERRGASTRTIANQLAAIFRKLGVGSRAELAARVRPSDFV